MSEFNSSLKNTALTGSWHILFATTQNLIILALKSFWQKFLTSCTNCSDNSAITSAAVLYFHLSGKYTTAAAHMVVIEWLALLICLSMQRPNFAGGIFFSSMREKLGESVKEVLDKFENGIMVW